MDNWTPPKHDILEDIPDDYEEHKPEHPTPLLKPDEGEGDRSTLPRVDLYQKLMDAYEADRFRWATFKAKARPKDMAKASPSAIDDYNRMLANYAPIVDKKLEALWTMLLVRGQYHRVRRFIGFVDVESAPESLQRAKESLRASVMRSIDDSEDIYPVYFTPATWASKLSTAFKPEDLLSSETVVRDQMFSKEKERSQLLTKRNQVKASQQDVKPLEDAEIAARNTYLESRDKMIAGYSDTAVQLIKMYFDAKLQNARNEESLLTDLGDKKEIDDIMTLGAQPPLKDEQWKELKTMQYTCIQNQTALQRASEAVARAQLGAASARGGDATSYLYELDERIASLTIDIDYLSQILEKSANATLVKLTKPGKPGEDPLDDATIHVVPTKASLVPQEGDASIWQEVCKGLEKSSSYTTTMAAAHASHLDWSVNLFFGSASGSSNESGGSSLDRHQSSNTKIDIAFRCMKVVMNRPWFNAGVLGRTQEYYRNFRTPITAGSPDALKAAFLQPDPVQGPAATTLTNASKAILPAYPVAFIVVKDVHIVLTSDSNFQDSEVADIQKSMSAGGGLLCFSCAKSESSTEHRTAASVAHDGSTLSIKIPAPQIIGWIQQLTPQDMCQQSYGPIDQKEFLSFQDNQGSGTKPAPGPAPTPNPNPNPDPNPAPTLNPNPAPAPST